jgi:Uma2 family endonuclease
VARRSARGPPADPRRDSRYRACVGGAKSRARGSDGSGIGFDSSTGFLLPNGAERAPDAAWLRRERWEALTREQRRKFVPLCPDFVIELRSPSNDLADLQAKMEEYIACGARLGWLIDVDAKHAWVYRPGRPVESIEDASSLQGDPELPGLRVEVATLE